LSSKEKSSYTGLLAAAAKGDVVQFKALTIKERKKNVGSHLAIDLEYKEKMGPYLLSYNKRQPLRERRAI